MYGKTTDIATIFALTGRKIASRTNYRPRLTRSAASASARPNVTAGTTVSTQ